MDPWINPLPINQTFSVKVQDANIPFLHQIWHFSIQILHFSHQTGHSSMQTWRFLKWIWTSSKFEKSFSQITLETVVEEQRNFLSKENIVWLSMNFFNSPTPIVT